MIPILPSPLVQRTLLGAEPIAATIKVHPDDFVVDEMPLFDLSGEGEHLYVGVQKRGVSHQEMVSRLARHFGVPTHSIGSAGMKDRQALTLQAVSIHLLNRAPPAVDPGWSDMGIVWMKRHRHRLRRGQLAGNRFSIRLRSIDPIRAPTLWRRLQELEAIGLPDAFGPQRFGTFGQNHMLGWCLLHGRADEFVELMLSHGESHGESHSSDRAHEALQLVRAKRYKEAEHLLSRHQRMERHILAALAKGRPAAAALHAAGAPALEFLVSGIQSAVFNRVLESRMRAGTLNKAVLGDILWRPGAHGRFRFDEERAHDHAQCLDIEGRIASGALSASGPMFGNAMDAPTGEPARLEAEAMAAFHLDTPEWRASQYAPEGTRRPLRVPIRHPQIDAGMDERGPFVRVAFDLPAGAFATSLLHELLGAAPTDGSRHTQPAQSAQSAQSSESSPESVSESSSESSSASAPGSSSDDSPE